MALYGLTIEKETLWHGELERFNNTYYYEGPAEPPDAAGLRQFIDAVVTAEKNVHGSNVTFKQGRVWTAGGTKEQNVTIALVDLSGQGVSIGAPIFKEAAVLVEWETARANILGKKVYLRKFIRPCALISTMSAEAARGEEGLTAGMKNHFVEYGNQVQTVAAPAGVNWQLRSPGGRLPKANNNAVCNTYLGSREFRRN